MFCEVTIELYKMGKCKDISNNKKIQIQTLLETGLYSHREIARKAAVSHQTIGRIAVLMKENIPSTSSGRTYCGASRKTTDREDRIIINRALQNRQLSNKELKRLLEEDNIKISERTLKSRLYEANIRSRRPAKKPKLTVKMKRARLQWAKQHQHFTIEDWEKVCTNISFVSLKFSTLLISIKM